MKLQLNDTKDKIRGYYKTAELELPKYSSWRVYKFRLCNGKFVQLPQVSSIEELRRYLMRYAPLDVWYSSCLFLSPKNVRGKNCLPIPDQ